MIKENQAEFDICGINKFWSKGYTGKGIKVANMEKTNPDLWFFDGKVSTPTGHVYDKFENYHGNQTMDCIHQVAPDADLITLSKSAKSSNNYIEGVIIDVSIPYMINNGVHLVNASLGGNNNKMLNDIIVNAQSHGVVFCTSAGNVAEKGLKGYAKSNKWISVGAVHYYDHDKKTKLASYSSRGKELDITCFSNLHIHDARKGYKGRTFPVEGTSFSSPMFTGMLALVQQFFLEKIGRTLYQDEIELFIQDHVVDLGAEGWDEMYGHGLFVLPEPDAIDVEKYLLRDKPPIIIPKELKEPINPEQPTEPTQDIIKKTMSTSDYNLYINFKNIYINAKKDNNKVAMDYAKQSALELLNKYGLIDDAFDDEPIENPPIEEPINPEPLTEEPELPIIGLPTATIEQMKEWAKSKKANQLLIDLAPIFYDVSVSVGINPVVTYCQSAKETGYMHFGGVLDASYFNPCGMKTSAGGPNNDPNAHQRFDSWNEGIRAQVDHLALYAGADGYPKSDTPDPRHFAYLHGTAKTVEELGGKWAGSATYGTDIVKMMREIENTKVEEPVGPVDPEPVEKLETMELDLRGKTIVGVNWNGGRITIVYKTKDE